MVPENKRCYSVTKPQYADCSCSETTLYFHNCQCGARTKALTEQAHALIPTLTPDQERAMMATTGAIPILLANRLGYGLKKLGLSTGRSRSGDNADVMTDLGEIVQNILREHRRVLDILSS